MPKILAANLAEHRQLVRDSLLDALDALLDEREYDRITLTDIAARAGVARNTIYNYAPDKAALLLAAVRRSTEGIDEAVRSIAEDSSRSAPERLMHVIEYLLTFFASGTHRVFVLQAQFSSLEVEDQAMATGAIDSVQSHIARVLRDGAEEGVFRVLVDPKLELTFISGAMAAAVRGLAIDQDRVSHIVSGVANFILCAVRH